MCGMRRHRRRRCLKNSLVHSHFSSVPSLLSSPAILSSNFSRIRDTHIQTQTEAHVYFACVSDWACVCVRYSLLHVSLTHILTDVFSLSLVFFVYSWPEAWKQMARVSESERQTKRERQTEREREQLQAHIASDSLHLTFALPTPHFSSFHRLLRSLQPVLPLFASLSSTDLLLLSR